MEVRKLFTMVVVGLCMVVFCGVAQAMDGNPILPVSYQCGCEEVCGDGCGCDDGCGVCGPCCNGCCGYDNGFFITTRDGCFTLRARALVQARYIGNWRKLPRGQGQNDEYEGGFQIARAKVLLAGNMGSRNLSYDVVLSGDHTPGLLASDRYDGDANMETAQIKYQFGNGVVFNVGRFRNLAFMREEATSYARQLAVERSFLNEIFTMDYVEGFGLSQQRDRLMWQVVVSDGQRSGSMVTRDFFEDNTDIAASGRVDFKIAGNWAQMGDFSSWQGEDWGVFVGGAAHWEDGETQSAVANTNNFISWTIDGSIEGYGLGIYGAAVGQDFRNPGGVGDSERTGFLGQVAYMVVPDKLEPFVRYEYIDYDGTIPDDNVSMITFGVNRYFNKHAAKLTADFIYAFDTIPAAPYSYANTGLLQDTAPFSDQTVARVQMQLFF